LCGGPSEQPLADHILNHISGVTNLIDATRNPLQETIALLGACDFYIGNDTSLMNLAVNQGKKALTFFGPTLTVYNPLTIPLTSPSQKVSDISLEEVLQRIDNSSF
jgi:ADP-heptose:LPS heptosyltransferase